MGSDRLGTTIGWSGSVRERLAPRVARIVKREPIAGFKSEHLVDCRCIQREVRKMTSNPREDAP